MSAGEETAQAFEARGDIIQRTAVTAVEALADSYGWNVASLSLDQVAAVRGFLEAFESLRDLPPREDSAQEPRVPPQPGQPRDTCSRCGGAGHLGNRWQPCPKCKGMGRFQEGDDPDV